MKHHDTASLRPTLQRGANGVWRLVHPDRHPDLHATPQPTATRPELAAAPPRAA